MKTKIIFLTLLSIFSLHLQAQIKYEDFNKKMREYYEQEKACKDQLRNNAALTPQAKDSLQKQLKTINDEVTKFSFQSVRENRDNSRFLSVLVNQLRPKLTSDEYEAELKAFSPTLQNTKEWKYEMEYLKNQRLMAPGNTAPDFEVKNHAGKTIRFSGVYKKNKLTLLDFWASWCGPCRASMPHLKELYDKYHSKGLEIFSVSIDGNKEMWENAYNKLQLPWIDGSNLGGNTDPLMLKYAFRAIPHKVLVDHKGKIIGINFSEKESLEKTIETHLQKVKDAK